MAPAMPSAMPTSLVISAAENPEANAFVSTCCGSLRWVVLL
jgi:hypothetical protein